MTAAQSKPLSPKHQAFADKVLTGSSATEAYAEVYGCTVKAAGASGYKLLKKAEIALYLAEKQQVASEKAAVTVSYVLENLTEIVERCMQRAPVMVGQGKDRQQAQDEDGNAVWQFDAKGANTALQTIAKHLGMLKDPKADAMTAIADAIRAARERAARR